MKVQDYDPVVDTAVGVAEDPSGNLKMLQVDNDGKLIVDANVDLGGATVNISGDLVADVNTIEETLGLKTDAAATQDTGTMSMVSLFKRGLAHLTSIIGRLPNLVSGKIPVEATFPSTQNVSVQNASIPVTDNGGSLTVDGTVTANVTFPTTQPISATALPLPLGASTETTLGSLLTMTTSVRDNQGLGSSSPATDDTGNWNVVQLLKRGLAHLTSILGRLPNLVSNRVPVDGSGVTQPVSGPLTDAQLRNAAVVITAQSLNFSEATGTAPTTSTEVLGQNAARKYLLIQNLSTAPFHISIGGTASTSSLRIDGGATLVFEGPVIPSQNIRMIQTTSSQSYYILHG